MDDFERIAVELIFCVSSFAEKAWLFKSHLMPAKLSFRTTDDQEYVVSYRVGGVYNCTILQGKSENCTQKSNGSEIVRSFQKLGTTHRSGSFS